MIGLIIAETVDVCLFIYGWAKQNEFLKIAGDD